MKDHTDTVTPDLPLPAKRGRPAKNGAAMTPAERTRASRIARKQQYFAGFPHRQITVMLGPNANKALTMLTYGTDKTQTEVIESLLIAAYRAKKEEDMRKERETENASDL